MIDIEGEVFARVAQKVRDQYPKIFITGEYVKTPPSFPCVSLVEQNNQTYKQSQTTDSQENHVVLLYELDVYSNLTRGKKSQCKAIASIVDEELLKLGFSRTMLNPIPNMEDATIYRMKGRYTAIVSKNHVIYRR